MTKQIIKNTYKKNKFKINNLINKKFHKLKIKINQTILRFLKVSKKTKINNKI